MSRNVEDLVGLIRARAGAVPVRLGLILGSGLGHLAAISTITNMAAGLSDEPISHAHTKAMAPLGAAKLEQVLRHFLRHLR